MSVQRKSIDGFIPSEKNRDSLLRRREEQRKAADNYDKTHLTSAEETEHTLHSGRGIPANSLLKKKRGVGGENLADAEVEVQPDERPGEAVRRIVPLPTPNGNDLELGEVEDEDSVTEISATPLKVKSKHTLEEFIDGYEEEGDDTEDGSTEEDIFDEIPSERVEEKADTLDDESIESDEPEEDAELEELESEDAEDAEENEEPKPRMVELPRQKAGLMPSFDGILRSRRAAKDEDAEEGENDNDLELDDDSIKSFRSRQLKREMHEQRFKDEPNMIFRVIVGAVVLALTIVITYFVFAFIYKAPQPAEVNAPAQDVVENTTKDLEPKPVETPEEPVTIAVYNASDIAGKAKDLAAKLVAAGKNAGVGATNSGNASLQGNGYAILDFTNGKKPKGLDAVKALLEGGAEVIPVADRANPPVAVETDKDLVIIIR